MGWLDSLYHGIFDDSNDSAGSDYRNDVYEERNEREYYGGWYGHKHVVGGPVKIEHTGSQSIIRCYAPGRVYSGADHPEYTPSGTYAITAYWSGSVLYAQLSNGSLCEWKNPGCPLER